MAASTVETYGLDLRGFARWFSETLGELFTARAVTATDVRDYRAHLRTVERRQAATVNRKLASLRRFSLWAKATDRVHELPTAGVKGTPTPPPARSRWPNGKPIG